MSDGHPNVTVGTDANFEEEVLNHDGFVLVDFWAEWCGPCKLLTPEIEKIADEQVGKIKIVELDVDANPQTAAKYQILSIPTIMLVTPGKNEEGKRKSAFTMGFRPKPQLMDWLKQSGFDPNQVEATGTAPAEEVNEEEPEESI